MVDVYINSIIMHYLKSIAILFMVFFAFANSVHAQVADSTIHNFDVLDSARQDHITQLQQRKKWFNIRPYILPGIMIAYGFTAIENKGLQSLDVAFQKKVYAESPHKNINFDNFLQFAPAAMVYGFDALGIKAKHDFRDRTMLFLISNIFANGSVFSVKKLSPQLRPDGSDYTSFPSGHAARAFANAEFLRQEYKDVSPWYGIAGYTMAVATGYLRMYNNKHWFSDVIAGAGIGIASTKLAYWLYPKIKHKFFKDKPMNTMVMPYYQNKTIGFSLVHSFARK